MLHEDISATSRRRFLQYLAASPLLASRRFAALAEEAGPKLPDPMIWAPQGLDPIKSPKDAINVFDFESVAFKNVPPAHFGHMASGIDDEVTLRANREEFLKFQLCRVASTTYRRSISASSSLAAKYNSPVFVSPTGANLFFHPDGEVAVAKAARAGNHLQILSTSSNFSVDDVTKARGAPIWFQLYASPSFDVAQGADQAGRRRRLSGAGGDGRHRIAGRNHETLFRLMKIRHPRMFGMS